MKKLVITSLTFLSLLFASHHYVLTSEELDIQTEKARIQSLIENLDKALQHKDLKTLSQIFSPEASFIYIGPDVREKAIGWKALEVVLKSQFKSLKNLRINPKELNIEIDSPQSARYVREINIQFFLNNLLFSVEDIRETGVLEKMNDKWVIIQQHASAPITDQVWPFYISPLRKTSTAYHVDRKFSIEELKEDYDLLRLSLEEAHAGMYLYTPKKEFDSLFNSLCAAINQEMTEVEFFRFVSPIIEKIHCLHTRIASSSDYQKHMDEKGLFFPLQLKFISDNAYVIMSFDQENQITLGSKVLSINNKPLPSVVGRFKKMLPSDGKNETYKDRIIERYFQERYFLYIDQPDHFIVEYIPFGEKAPVTLTLPGVPLKLVYQNRPSFKELYQEALKLQILEEYNTAILTIKTFVPRILDHFELRYEEFLKSSFQEITDRHIQNLVIDLRDNDGGEGQYGAKLLSYLMDKPFRSTKLIDTPRTRYSFLEFTDKGIFFNKIHPRLWMRDSSGRYVLKGNLEKEIEPESPHFSGKVYILINGMSISATSGFAALAHYHKRAAFIGEETGGAYYSDNGGDFLKLTLPHTGLRIIIPIRSYTLRVSDYPFTDRGLIPDYEVKPKIEDILQGKDTELEFALNLIKKNQEK